MDGCDLEYTVFESAFSRIPKPSPTESKEEINMSFMSSYHPSPNEQIRHFGSSGT
jgi:hypothetical protein